MISNDWNKFLFSLKNDRELLEFTKNSQRDSTVIEQGYSISKIRYIIEIDRVIYERFIEFIDEFKKKLEMFFIGSGDDFFEITEVSVEPIYETFVDWDAVRGIETKESITEKIKKIKHILSSWIGLSIGDLYSEDEYIELNNYLETIFKQLGLKYPNKMKTHSDVYYKFKEIKTGDGSWAARDLFIEELYKDSLNTLNESIDDKQSFDKIYAPTGWASIDNDIKLMLTDYEKAEDLIRFKAVGNMLSDILEKTANQVYIDFLHFPSNFEGENVSKTDVKRMLEGYFEHEFSGKSNKEYREFTIRTVDLVNKIRHSSSTEKWQLTLAVDGVLMLVRLVNVLDKNSKKE